MLLDIPSNGMIANFYNIKLQWAFYKCNQKRTETIYFY